MVKYKLIIEYYQKGNNNSQIATLCGCSRTVVWEVLNRFNKIETITKVQLIFRGYESLKAEYEKTDNK